MKRTTLPLPMFPAALLAMLCGLAGAAHAGDDVHVHIHCAADNSGRCAPPPAPPLPPAPPAAPAVPTPPAPPPLPPVPKIPDVPAAAHAACASKSPGSTLTWELGKGETMTGVCEQHDGKMRFTLRSYDLDD